MPGFDLRSLPQVNMAAQRQPVGFPGGNVRPVMPVQPDGRGGGVNPGAPGPQPNANAFEHANANARFMRADGQGHQFADNPQGQRPAMSDRLLGAMVPQNGQEDEMRKRRMLAEMAARMGHGGGGMQQGAPYPGPSGGIYGGYPNTQFPTAPMPSYSTLPLQQPNAPVPQPSYSFGTLPLAEQPQQPAYSFPAAPLPQQNLRSMYDLISPFQGA